MPDTLLAIQQQIIGTEMSAVTFVRDYVQLDFDGPKFNALTQITVASSKGFAVTGNDQFRNHLCEQIAKPVADVRITEEQEVMLSFADGSSIHLSLKSEDYRGPEAVVFNGNENLCDVL
jgi:hypothetical protein